MVSGADGALASSRNILGVLLVLALVSNLLNHGGGVWEFLNALALVALAAVSFYANTRKDWEQLQSARKAAAPAIVPDCTVAFLGLGTMGSRMALNLGKHEGVTLHVWNRSEAATAALEAKLHHDDSSVRGFDSPAEAAAGCDIVFLCLPTTKVVAEVCDSVGSGFKQGAIVVDCTSGEPEGSRVVAKALEALGIGYVDAPVSGGPTGAANATLTMMVGAKDESTFASVKPLLDVVGKRIVHVGPVGSGHAVKAVNNSLMASSLLASTEGLCALAAAGIKPETALSIINSSSGRNLATQERIPKYVLTRKFDFGFALGLLRKDNGIAVGMLDSSLKGGYIEMGFRLLSDAVDKFGPDVDFTNAARLFEQKAGVELNCDTH